MRALRLRVWGGAREEMMTDRPAALEVAAAPTARVLARRAAAKRKRQQMDKDARNTARRGERRRRRARDAAAQAEASRLAGGFVGWPVQGSGSIRRNSGGGFKWMVGSR